MADLAAHLPEDLLLDVLGRLTARSLAVCRSVCKPWCDVVNGRCLLRTDHVPLSLHGVFVQLGDPGWPYRLLPPKLFSRHSTARDIADLHMHGPRFECRDLVDCCNGLLLLPGHVVNPATQQWARLPPDPLVCALVDSHTPKAMENSGRRIRAVAVWQDPRSFGSRYLVFDPAVSLHYEVVLVPSISIHIPADKPVCAMEWPPTPYIMHVFSSKTGKWEDRSFVREGEAARTIADCRSKEQDVSNYGAYYRGALYVPCRYDFVLRINLSSDGYHVLKLPEGKRLQSNAPRLGKSERGVHCVFRYACDAFQVWFLNESCGRMEWQLKNDINFDLVHKSPCTIVGGSWILQRDDNDEELVQEDNSEWDPNSANVVSVDAWVGMPGPNATFHFLGFHPYIGIALFEANGSIMAYHLSTSNVRDLGYIPKESNEIQVSLAYMPCWMGPLPGSS